MHRWDNIDKALDWVYSFTNLERNQDKRKEKNAFQLNPIIKMDQHFSNPSQKIKTIHIAGSKGKGTVSYLLAKYFEKMDLKVGLYTSPHIIEVRERIKINDKMIEVESFLSILDRIYDYVETLDNKYDIPSFFDIFTELAFIYFYEQKVDLAIIEVGLGGRLDSTNIVKPFLSIITTITYEHTEVLGKTLAKIAGEKGGIIKENVPVILSKNCISVYEKIKRISIEKKSKLYYSSDYIKLQTEGFIRENKKIYSKYKIRFLDENINDNLYSSLIGEFQIPNIETAILATKVASDILNRKYNFLECKNILKTAYWPSRFEIKFYKDKIIIIDGAHTEESIRQLVKTIKKMIKQKIIRNDIAIITGMMKDKNHRGMLKNLLKIGSFFYFVELDKWKDSKVSNYIDIFKDLLNQRQIKIKNKTIDIKYLIQEGIDWNGVDLIDKVIEYKNVNTIVITGSLYLAQYFQKI